MKICFFTKYPPIEGGSSSRSYWLARGLGEKGVEVHIVTDALEKKLWQEKINFENTEDLVNLQPQNVYFHSLDALGERRPDFNKRKNEVELLKTSSESRLVNLGLRTIETYGCEIIDSRYFFPYGIAAYFTSKITGRPLILRHAGSDINRILDNVKLRNIFKEIFYVNIFFF